MSRGLHTDRGGPGGYRTVSDKQAAAARWTEEQWGQSPSLGWTEGAGLRAQLCAAHPGTQQGATRGTEKAKYWALMSLSPVTTTAAHTGTLQTHVAGRAQGSSARCVSRSRGYSRVHDFVIPTNVPPLLPKL